MDCVVHGVAKTWTQLSAFHFQNNPQRIGPFSGGKRKGVWYEIGDGEPPLSLCSPFCLLSGQWSWGLWAGWSDFGGSG